MYYVITRDDSIVVGITKHNAYELNLPNVSIHEMEDPIPDLNQHVWNFQTGEFDRAGYIYTKRQFLAKFTLEERTAIRASTDPIVIDIMNMLELAEYVSVIDPTTQQGVGYLAMAGLIAPTRVQEILE
jgi:hypothetical protein